MRKLVHHLNGLIQNVGLPLLIVLTSIESLALLFTSRAGTDGMPAYRAMCRPCEKNSFANFLGAVNHLYYWQYIYFRLIL
jgi:hypothetical protein